MRLGGFFLSPAVCCPILRYCPSVHGAVLAFVWLLLPHAAFGTSRPVECPLAEGVRVANIWERAKEPNLRRYCDLLASGMAKLVGPGSDVLVKEIPKIADDADKLLPGRASPNVLKGRAYLRLGKPAEARAALEEAKRRDERALDDPIALLAWARANARTGRLAEAAQAFRAALPRASALPQKERSLASFEAAMAVMSQGRTGLDDAIAMLREARRDAADGIHVAVVAALGLALDRAGERDEARAVLAEHGRFDIKALTEDPEVIAALTDAGVPEEGDALAGNVLEGEATPAGRAAWRRYLDGAGGKGVWAEHAREHAGVAAKKKDPPRATRREGER